MHIHEDDADNNFEIARESEMENIERCCYQEVSIDKNDNIDRSSGQ